MSGPCAIGELGNPQQQVESTRTRELKELNNGRLAMIAVAAGLLGLLVLRPQRSESRSARPKRNQPERIDWSSLPGRAAADRQQEESLREAA